MKPAVNHGRLFAAFDYLFAFVHAGFQVNMMAAYRLARIGILDPVGQLQGVMRAAHVLRLDFVVFRFGTAMRLVLLSNLKQLFNENRPKTQGNYDFPSFSLSFQLCNAPKGFLRISELVSSAESSPFSYCAPSACG